MFKYGFILTLLFCAWPLYALKSFTVEGPSSLTEEITLKGKWVPMNLTPVRAPIEGTLVEVLKPYGSQVQEGELLFRLSFDGLELNIKEAELDYQRKKETLRTYETFEQSVEYLEAHHAMLMAEQALQNRQKYYEETKVLAEMGGVSKEALTQDKLSYDTALQTLKIATLRFDELKDRKSKIAFQQANLEVEQAYLRLTDLQKKRKQLNVKAPSSGILFSPAILSSQTQAPILSVGEVLENKQALGVIAREDTYGITLELNETQMAWFDKARYMTAKIADQNIPLHTLSIEPLNLQNADMNHRYLVGLKLETAPKVKPRLGAGIEIALMMEHEVQLKVPLEALVWAAQTPCVKRFDHKKEIWSSAEVQLGVVNREWAEVVSGIQKGDIIGLPDTVG